MGSSGLRLLCGVSVLALLSACGDLAVQSFTGSVIELSLTGSERPPPGSTSSSGPATRTMPSFACRLAATLSRMA